MKQVGWVIVVVLVLPTLPLFAQSSSLDALEKDLDQLKQQRQDATTQSLSLLLDQLGTAMGSPEAALELYQKAGGALPDAAPVLSHYEHETPDEKAQRTEKDAAATRDFASIVQLHCGLMRFGVLFLDKPETPNLQDDWVAWLKSAATIYGNLSSNPDLKSIPLKGSIFNAYFDFKGWDKEQAQWNVHELPALFRTNVIDPLRAAHSPDLLAAWDLYIGMRSVDQPDEERWTNSELPYLKFERGSDDFTLAPSADKLSTLVDLIKSSPSNPKIDDMIARTHQMMQDFRTLKAGAVPGTPPPDATAPASPAPTATGTAGAG